MSKCCDFIGLLFLARDTAHSVHLNTRSFAKHKALQKFYEGVIDLADTLAEAYQGRHGLIGPISLMSAKKTNNIVEFLEDNIRIQVNLMHAAHGAMVKNFIFLGSSCIYPKDSQQPIKEEYLMTGPLEPTNSAYAIAKIAGIELVNSYRKQYGYNWISLMPTNLYGPRDNFDLNTSHVLPALIRRFVEAVDNGVSTVTLWGTGSPKREFLYVDDLAGAVLVASEKYNSYLHLNIGTGKELSIKELAQKIAMLTGFNGTILWDSSKPDGTKRKLLDISRIKQLGWSPRVTLDEGLASTISWYKSATAKGESRR